MRVAELLNEWWPLRAGPALAAGLPAGASLAHQARRAGWGRFTGSALTDARAIPVLWSVPFEQRDDVDPAGRRQLADRPLTAGRAQLWLPDPAPTLLSGFDPSPLRASGAVQFAMTANHVAVNLEDRAALPKSPARSLRGEAAAYRTAADGAEALLDALTAPCWDQAQSEVAEAAAGRTGPPPVRRAPVQTVPGQVR